MQMCTYWCVYVCAWKTDATIFIQNTKPNAKRMKKKSSQSYSQSNTRTGIKCRTMKIVYTLAHLYIFYNLRVCWHLVWTFSIAHNERTIFYHLNTICSSHHTVQAQIFRFFLQILSTPRHCTMSNACRIPHNLSCQSYHLHRFTSTTLCVSWDGWSFFIIFVWRWNDVAFYCRWCSRVKHTSCSHSMGWSLVFSMRLAQVYHLCWIHKMLTVFFVFFGK